MKTKKVTKNKKKRKPEIFSNKSTFLATFFNIFKIFETHFFFIYQ